MELFIAEDSDSLSSLEERITRAVQLVRTLRDQNAELQKKLESVTTERDAALANLSKSKNADLEAEKYKAELDQMKTERKHVRSRIEKLLGQMDLLANQ
jgi:FtsZ-binding cell division protein ZapB